MSRFLREEFEKNIPDTIKKTLKFCSKAADEESIPIFLIGGIVRDIIIDKKNFDVDITVEGNAIDFAQMLQSKYPDICTVKELHDSFKTAKVEFCLDNQCINIDLASTRKELYPYPACLPVIEEIGCPLYEDVSRRDFSINSMALSLNEKSFCKLVDYLNGFEHLKKGAIQVLHPESFIDDPTRIIRALKFSVRFNYKYGAETENLMQACLNSGRFDNLAGERIKLELKQTFNLNRAECLSRFITENIYKLVNTSISIPENIEKLSSQTQQTVIDYCKSLQNCDNIWLIHLGVLLADLSQEKIKEIAEKMYLSGNEENILLGAKVLCENAEDLKNAQSRFEVYEFFEKSSIESMLVFLIKNKALKDKLDLYLNELKDITISSNGDTLINMGLKPGPAFGKILREVLKAKINKIIETSEEEVSIIKRNLL